MKYKLNKRTRYSKCEIPIHYNLKTRLEVRFDNQFFMGMYTPDRLAIDRSTREHLEKHFKEWCHLIPEE